jgi:hypothetical protein
MMDLPGSAGSPHQPYRPEVKMNLTQILDRGGLPEELQRQLQLLLAEKDKYTEVMKELTGCYNQGLWWLTVPNVRFSWQMIFDSIDHDPWKGLHYYLPRGKVRFLDYERPDQVADQVISHQYVVYEIEGWPEDDRDEDIWTDDDEEDDSWTDDESW